MFDVPQPSELSDLVRLQRTELEERLADGLCADATRELTGGHTGGGAAADWCAWLRGVLAVALRRVRPAPAAPSAPAPEDRAPPHPRRRISSGRMEVVRG